MEIDGELTKEYNVNYFATGFHNASDWAMYAPFGCRCERASYKFGWFIGIWTYPFNRRREWRK